MRSALLLLSLVSPLLAQSAQTRPDGLLDSLRDHARPVLIFAGPHDARAARQYFELVRHSEELRDRQMVIVLATRTPFATAPAPPAGTVQTLDAERRELCTRFHIGPDAFAVVLVGKDGGEKFRSTQPVSFAALRSRVDSMPMRRQEMQTR